MDISLISDLAREAIFLTLRLGLPVLLAALATGILIGLLQAMTQIQEQTLAFVPKVLVILIVLSLLLPSMLTTMTEYMQTLIAGIPGRL